jgi:hypothetical protein
MDDWPQERAALAAEYGDRFGDTPWTSVESTHIESLLEQLAREPGREEFLGWLWSRVDRGNPRWSPSAHSLFGFLLERLDQERTIAGALRVCRARESSLMAQEIDNERAGQLTVLQLVMDQLVTISRQAGHPQRQQAGLETLVREAEDDLSILPGQLAAPPLRDSAAELLSMARAILASERSGGKLPPALVAHELLPVALEVLVSITFQLLEVEYPPALLPMALAKLAMWQELLPVLRAVRVIGVWTAQVPGREA